MPKLLLLWNVIPDQQDEFGEALEHALAGLGAFSAVRGASFQVAMLPSRKFRPASAPRFDCMLEVGIRSASALPLLWSDPEFRQILEELMATVADFTVLTFQMSLTAREVMSREIRSVLPSAPFQDLVELLARHRISGVPVVDQEGSLVGIVTEADVLSRSGSTVADIMTPKVLTVSEDAALEDIAQTLTRNRIRRVPIVREGKVVGIVSREDVVRAMASL